MANHTFDRPTSKRFALIAAALPFALLMQTAAASSYFTETQNYVQYTTIGSNGSTTVYKDTTDTGPFGAGSSAVIAGDNQDPGSAIVLHANASAGFGAAHLQADAQFVRNHRIFANWDLESYHASSHIIMTMDDFIISGPTGSNVNTSINLLLDGSLQAASTLADTFTSGVFSSSGVSVGVFANNVSVGSGFYNLSSSDGVVNSPGKSGLFANFTGHNIVTTNTFSLPVNVPVTIKFDLSIDASAGMTIDTGGNALTNANFGNTISFATDRPVFNLPAGYTVNSASAGIAANTVVVPEPGTLLLIAASAALLCRRRHQAAC